MGKENSRFTFMLLSFVTLLIDLTLLNPETYWKVNRKVATASASGHLESAVTSP